MCDQPEDINLSLARKILLFIVSNADVNTMVRLWQFLIDQSAIHSYYDGRDTLSIHSANLMLPKVQAALSYLVSKGDK